jgi:hypothetical protein
MSGGQKETSRGGLGDRGAVAVEFAILFPVLLMMFWGVFEAGMLMTDYMRLTYVVQGAAQVGAAAQPIPNPAQGVAWARPLLQDVAFSGSLDLTCGVRITGQTSVNFGVLGTLPLSQTACWPIPLPPTTPPTTP